MLRRRLRGAGEWVSRRLTGVGAWVTVAILTFLAAVGNLTTARDILGVQVGTNALVAAGLLVIGVNWIYGLYRRAGRAEHERDEAKAALLARADSADAVRLFLGLHDQGPEVLSYFDDVLEALPTTIPVGRQRYQEWIARCAEAIHEYRPAYTLPFRQSQIAPRRGGAVSAVIVTDDDGLKRYVSMAEVAYYKTLVAQSTAILAEIVEAG